jgi:hypothetical protein
MLGRISLRQRMAALLPLGALAVHDLRYRLAYGGDAGHQLEHQGHAYLGVAKPLLGVLCALVAAELLSRLARAWRLGEVEERPLARRRLWALSALALVVVFTGQELIEGAVFAGHPAGVAAVLGGGGWLAVPLSLVVAGGLTLLLVGAHELVRAAARRRGPTGRRRPARTRRLPLDAPLRRLTPLAGTPAGRAPPFVAPLAT